MFPSRTSSSIGFAAGGACQLEQILSSLRALSDGAKGHPLTPRDCFWLLSDIAQRARRLALARIALLAEGIVLHLRARRFDGRTPDRAPCDIALLAIRRLAVLMEFHAAGFQAIGADQAILLQLRQAIEGAGASQAGSGSGAGRAAGRDRRATARLRQVADGPSDPGLARSIPSGPAEGALPALVPHDPARSPAAISPR